MKPTSKRKSLKLPNAPLAEVIFELRWALPGDPTVPIQIRQDPGYVLLTEGFTALARKRGFRSRRAMSADSSALIAGHSVGFRFFPVEEAPYPIWQIGPGIFACNESVNYEWPMYRQLCLKGIETLYSTYPRISHFSLEPVHLELRYVDVFTEDMLGHNDILQFLRQNTKLGFQLKEFSANGRLASRTEGRALFAQKTKADTNTDFSYEVAGGSSSGKPSMIVISKVTTRKDKIAAPVASSSREKFYAKWLDDAHEITSQFFKDFVSDQLMRKFKATVKAGS